MIDCKQKSSASHLTRRRLLRFTYELGADGVCCPPFTCNDSFSEVKRIGKELSINEQIRAREVRVVSDTNEQLGIMTLHEAIRIAEDKGLDLVEVAPNGRHRYAVS